MHASGDSLVQDQDQRSGSKRFDTLKVSVKEYLDKVKFEKNKDSRRKKLGKIPSMQRIKKADP